MSSETNDAAFDKDAFNSAGNGSQPNPQMTHEEAQVAHAAARFGYGPLAEISDKETRLPAFGGEFQPGLYRPVEGRKFANPAPLGLCAFALTTFVLGCINMGTRDITSPSIVIGPAFGYGGLIQLLAGMWYVCCRNWPFYLSNCLTNWGLVGKWRSATRLVLPRCLRTGASGSHSPSS
jgi:uncharacterized protein